MTKTNVWVSVVVALLAIGTLVGLVFSLRKISDIGGGDKTTVKVPTVDDTKKPAETTKKPTETTAPKREPKTVVTNANALYAYRLHSTDNKAGYVAYSNELKLNTKYLITFNFMEVDHQDFMNEHNLTFAYRVLFEPTGKSTEKILKPDGGKVEPGMDIEMTTDENGFLGVQFYTGPILTADEMSDLCYYIRDHLLFQISEIVG